MLLAWQLTREEGEDTRGIESHRASDSTNTLSRVKRFIIHDTSASCDECRIDAQRLLILGARTDSVLLRGLPRVARDSRGKYYAVVGGRGRFHEVLVYDSVGGLERTLGRHGRGPGEFESVYGVAVGPADSVFLMSSGSTISTFTPDGKFARSLRSPVGSLWGAMVALSTGDLIVSGWFHTPALAGLPAHVLGPDGSHKSAFGTPNLWPLGNPPQDRALALGTSGTVWAAGRWNNYRLEETDLSGNVLREIGVRAPWLGEDQPVMDLADAQVVRAKYRNVSIRDVTPEWERKPTRLPTAPNPELVGIRVDPKGQLWVAWRVGVDDWRQIRVRYRPLRDEVAIAPELTDRIYQTVVDVIDPQNGQLLARRRFPFSAHFAADRVLAHPFFTEDGYIQVEIWPLQLRQP